MAKVGQLMVSPDPCQVGLPFSMSDVLVAATARPIRHASFQAGPNTAGHLAESIPAAD